MNRSVRIGSILFAGYFVMAALEGLWMSAGPNWFPSAQEWAELHPPNSAARMVIICFLGFGIAWAVCRGHRLAWYLAVLWAGLILAAGLALLAPASFVVPLGDLAGFKHSHSAELIGGVFQMACLTGSLGYLCRKDARDWIFRRAGM